MSLNALTGTRLHWPIDEYRQRRGGRESGLLDGAPPAHWERPPNTFTP